MKIDGQSDIGNVRSSNQDFFDFGWFNDNDCWGIVCDGMGGANGGNIASKIAAENIKEAITSQFKEGYSSGNIKALMHNAITRANEAVYNASCENIELSGMGTTVVLLIVSEGKIHVAHIGDSRAYKKTPSGVEKLTMDHSYVQNLINMGQITEEEAKVHPKRNIITRALGVRDEVAADYECFDFTSGEVVLACTDGLTNYLSDDVLDEYIENYHDEELRQSLINLALEMGGADNITVLTIDNREA